MENTWAELRRRLEAAGASEETMESLRRATAGVRHAARTRRVVGAALEEAREHLAAHGEDIGDTTDLRIGEGQWWVGERERAVAALLVSIELNGAGGTGGLGGAGCATERMPIFGGWGSGRRNARDGAAWDAAAREALRGLAPKTSLGYDVDLRPSRILALSRETIPKRFAIATARSALLAVIEAEGRDAALYLGDGSPGGTRGAYDEIRLVVHGSAAAWAQACAEIEVMPEPEEA